MRNEFDNGGSTSCCRASAGLAAALALVATGLACTARAEGTTVSGMTGASMSGVTTSLGRAGTGGETLHVLVGHSLFLNTRSRLRRVYVADPAVLNSVTLSPNQIVVTAVTSGISTLVLLDEAGQAQSYIVSADLDIAGLRSAMAEAMHGNAVKIEGSGTHITLSGEVSTLALADTAMKLAGLYSKDVANALTITPNRAKQVRLKVRILEVDRTKARQFGVNLFNPGGNSSSWIASSSTSQYSSTETYTASSSSSTSGTLTTSNPLNFVLYSTKLNIGVNIEDLESKNILQILAEPTITAISGEKAEFHSGGEFPFPSVTGSGSSATVSVSFRPYGVALVFTPIVNADGSIRLKVAPEVSALDYTNAVTIDGYTIPALSTRKAETEVELRSDQSFAISGLLDQRTSDILEKTPGAASIPILGALFKSKNSSHSKTELVVVVTPTLVDPLMEPSEPAQPNLPIPPLNADKFDKSLGRNLNPQPAAPPILSPGFPGSQIPAAAPSSTAIATPKPAETAKVSTPAVAATPTVVETVQVPASTVVVTPPTAQSIRAMQTTQAASTYKPDAGSVAPSPSNSASPQTRTTPVATAAPQATTASAQAQTHSLPSGTSTPSQTLPAPAGTIYGPYIPYHPSATDGSTVGMAANIAAPHAPTSAPSPSKDAVGSSTSPSHAGAPMAVNLSSSSTHLDSSTRLMVQIMALSNSDGAESMVAALKRHGYDVTVNHDPRDSLFHLEVGPFASKTDAETMRQRLLREGYNAIIK